MGLRDRLLAVMNRRPPDFIIGGLERPYLLRWYITPWSGLYRDVPDEEKTLWQKFVRALPNVYLHKFLRSDDDRALHDHPWLFNCSVLLLGSYREWVPGKGRGVNVGLLREQGSWYFRFGCAPHRVELLKETYFVPHKEANLAGGGVAHERELPCVTLFITGPSVREWGFYCPKGWVPWKVFTATKDGVSTIGRGCE